MMRRHLVVALLLAAAFVLAACGGGSSDRAPTTTPATTPSATQPGGGSLPLKPDPSAVYAINADGTNPRLLFGDGDAYNAALSPDGRWLAIYAWKSYPQSMSLVLVDMGSGDATAIIQGGVQESIQFGGWSPDSRTLAYLRFAPTETDSGLFVYDIESRLTHHADIQRPSIAVWSAAGDALFAERSEPESTIYRVNFPSLEVRELARGALSGYGSFDVSPDGEQLVISSLDADPGGSGGTAKLTLVQASDGSGETELLSVHESSAFGFGGVSWSPDGSRIAYTRLTFGDSNADRGTYVIDAHSAGSPRITRATTLAEGYDTQPKWSADGAWLLIARAGCIACEGGYHAALAAADGSGEVPLPGTDQFEFAGSQAAWSPDGSRFAYGGDRLYSAQIRDPANAEPIADLPVSSYAPIAWTPDNASFVFIQATEISTATYALGPDHAALELLHVGQDALAPDAKTVAGLDSTGIFIRTASGQVKHLSGEAVQAVQPMAELASSNLIWSPDSSLLAVTLGQHGSSGLAVASLDGEVKLLAEKADVIRWSPDSKRIAYWAGGAVWTVDLTGSGRRRLAAASDSGFDWSPRGDEIAISDGGAVKAVRADGSGSPRTLFEQGLRQSTASDLRWSPDGQAIAISNGRELLIGSIETGSTRQVVRANIIGLEWLVDGTSLVFGAQPEQGEFAPGIYAFDIATGERTQLTYSAVRRHVVVGRLADGRVLFQSQFQL